MEEYEQKGHAPTVAEDERKGLMGGGDGPETSRDVETATTTQIPGAYYVSGGHDGMYSTPALPGPVPRSLKNTAEKKRWYILALFCYFSVEECICWFTFSSVPEASEEYYGISLATLNMLLNWGAIVFIILAPLVSALLTYKNGLRICILYGVWAVFFGACIRTIPCFVSEELRQKDGMIAVLHIGQIVVSLANPSMMISVAQLSCTWFPDNERTTATAIAFTSTSVGIALGFVIGPQVVHTSSEMPHLLYLEIAISVVPLLFVTIHFPSAPHSPPSAAARTHQSSFNEKPLETPVAPKLSFQLSSLLPKKWFKGLLVCLKRKNAVLVILAGGVEAGVSSGWISLIPLVLSSYNYTPQQAGWMGCANTIAATVGCVTSGAIVDKFLPYHMKSLICVECLLAILAFSWITLSLPSVMFAEPPIPSNIYTVSAALILAGLFQGAMYPVFLELAAEVTFPVGEGTSTGLITFLFNTLLLTVDTVFSYVRLDILNLVETCVLIVCGAMVLASTGIKYQRREVGKETLPGVN
ncbi:transporter, major facilitator subfamily protein [Pelomyxa schiedti]|nr:transporter, major facilitator subfamily protein [Pelomyxa schiedti]